MRSSTVGAAPPAGFRVGTFHIDPFAADKPLYSVTRANQAQYANVLTPGQKAMFAKYPTFRMDVYPTRRSASFPQRTYDFTKRNATSCELVANGEGTEVLRTHIEFAQTPHRHTQGAGHRRWRQLAHAQLAQLALQLALHLRHRAARPSRRRTML